VPSAAGALLLVHLLAGAHDLGPVLHVMRAGAALGELPKHVALDEILTRIQAENIVRHRDQAGRLTGERCDR
jgi:hypothetical protein